MDLMKIGTQLLMQKLGGSAGGEPSAIESALGSLVGQGSNMDLGGLVEMAKSKGLGDVAASWLGDGENASLTADQTKELVNDQDLGQLARAAGTDEDTVLDSLKDILPQLVDKGSAGGSLLDSIGGLAGATNLAKKLF